MTSGIFYPHIHQVNPKQQLTGTDWYSISDGWKSLMNSLVMCKHYFTASFTLKIAGMIIMYCQDCGSSVSVWVLFTLLCLKGACRVSQLLNSVMVHGGWLHFKFGSRSCFSTFMDLLHKIECVLPGSSKIATGWSQLAYKAALEYNEVSTIELQQLYLHFFSGANFIRTSYAL